MAAIVESVHGDGPESKETELWQNMYVSLVNLQDSSRST